MKTKVIVYWATTFIVALELLAGGVTDLLQGRTVLFVGEPVVEVLAHLGYPVYLLKILGLWRLLEHRQRNTIFAFLGSERAGILHDGA